MIFFLLLNIIATASLFVLFKFFEKWKVHTLQAIVVNYFVAFTLGWLNTYWDGNHLNFYELSFEPWLIHGAWLGLFFITFFHLIAFSSQKVGVSVTTVANKMAVVVPITVGILFYNDSVVWYKMLGIVLALVSVYLSTKRHASSVKTSGLIAIGLPIILFIGGGTMDVALHHVQTKLVPENKAAWFSTSIFLFSAICGSLVLITQFIRGKVKINRKSVAAGVLLGIPNYASIYFILRALDTEILESSVIFPIANVGGILFATLAAYFLLKEYLSKTNWLGVVLSVVAIFLIILESFLLNYGG